jgi:hypothetical protein
MVNEFPLLPERREIPTVTRESAPAADAGVVSTRDHEIIRQWANRVSAEPATGEQTRSGPATTLKVEDGGTGLRFNFPGVSPFRPISWAEWFDHFNSHDLTFVYDSPQADSLSARYRIVATSTLTNR